MFGICGVSSALMGFVFGGYFGDMPIVIMRKYMGVANPGTLALAFDPIENVVLFIVVALALGAVHMLAGMAIKFYMICKDSSVLDAFFDVGSYWVLFAGIGLIFVNSTVGTALCVCGILLLLLTQGRN
jgi:V/A-type H+-transporting ATPase subunit I